MAVTKELTAQGVRVLKSPGGTIKVAPSSGPWAVDERHPGKPRRPHHTSTLTHTPLAEHSRATYNAIIILVLEESKTQSKF